MVDMPQNPTKPDLTGRATNMKWLIPRILLDHSITDRKLRHTCRHSIPKKHTRPGVNSYDRAEMQTFFRVYSTSRITLLLIDIHHSPYFSSTTLNISNINSCLMNILNKLTLRFTQNDKIVIQMKHNISYITCYLQPEMR